LASTLLGSPSPSSGGAGGATKASSSEGCVAGGATAGTDGCDEEGEGAASITLYRSRWI
jgi:hypothetical protein